MNHHNTSLERFIEAQANTYTQALGELKKGRKTSHWMWYIFPQLKGLGVSSTSQYYGIDGLNEAKAYLAHPILSKRLIECCEVLVNIENKSAKQIFGSPDYLKLHSSMSLFYSAKNETVQKEIVKNELENNNAMQEYEPNLFMQVINKFYDGELDKNTMHLLQCTY